MTYGSSASEKEADEEESIQWRTKDQDLRQVSAGSTVKAVCAHNIGVQAGGRASMGRWK